MSEKVPSQASSKEVWDQLSPLVGSMASFGVGDLDSEHGVILKDWSAQDFANIYVRFRPHLISHARTFLREETQAEEVVQDAFLYLMTALPELDSELGVLRFLKWKTKMLCLDIIRSSQAGLKSNLVPLPDDVADKTQPIDMLERADDAAIIRMALAKLNSRHREALIATIYEQKSNAEVAKQLGVGENAFRQLLFRARASFRKALVGEVEIEGKSVSEILAVAARKASSRQTTVLVAFLVLSMAAISPQLSLREETAQQVTNASATAGVPPQVLPESGSRTPEPVREDLPKGVDSENRPQPAASDTVLPSSLSINKVSSYSPGLYEEEGAGKVDSQEFEMALAREAFNASLDKSLADAFVDDELELTEHEGFFVATNETGLKAHFATNLESQQIIQYFAIEFESNGRIWKAVPGNSLSVVEKLNGEILVSYAATDFLVGDFSGEFAFVSSTDSIFSKSGLKLDLLIGNEGRVTSAQLAYLPKP